jgi:hypothetical protein
MFKSLSRYFGVKENPILIIHFGYHKCMTVFFHRVFMNMSKEIGWEFKAFRMYEWDQFLPTAKDRAQHRMLLINNIYRDLSLLPGYFRGSHIIRDPRDLLVSGYKYHKWCTEPWAVEVMPEKFRMNIRLDEFRINKDLSGFSYQDLLNYVDKETGMMIELNRWRISFTHMWEWDYTHPKILELRYEEVFDNEVPTFKKIFAHYGLNESQTQAGLKHVQRFSFKNQEKFGKTGEKQHLSKGVSGQWQEHFFPELKDAFKKKYQDMLIKLEYERDGNW